jgi:hypothetical protein
MYNLRWVETGGKAGSVEELWSGGRDMGMLSHACYLIAGKTYMRRYDQVFP